MRLAILAAIISALVIFSNGVPASAGTGAAITLITSYDYPTADGSTQGFQISNTGTIAGYFTNSNNSVFQGFTRHLDGTFSEPIVDPYDDIGDTVAYGINQEGIVVGDFGQTTGDASDPITFHGFVLKHGVFTTYDVPGAFFTSPHAINDLGNFAGFYGTTSDSGLFDLGSAFAVIGGKLAKFTVDSSPATSAIGINNLDTIVGIYTDSENEVQGFIRTGKGKLIFPVEVPGAVSTATYGINDAGLIAGRYIDAENAEHGVIMAGQDYPAVIATFDYPGAVTTLFRDINDAGVISGDYIDSENIEHGFIAQLSSWPE